MAARQFLILSIISIVAFAQYQSTSPYVTTVHSEEAPQAIGPYSQGKVVNSAANLVFLSGQIGIDPETGNLVSDDVVEQTSRVMENLAAVLQAANSSFDNVVKAIVYLTDMSYFNDVNTEYAKYFTSDPPARVCFAVQALPKNAKVEIEFTAVSDN